MTEQEEQQAEDHLRSKGWYKSDQQKWMSPETKYDCCFEVAILVQSSRDMKFKVKKHALYRFIGFIMFMLSLIGFFCYRYLI